MMRVILLLILLIVSTPAFAQEKYLELELADDRVDITTGFNGTKIILFGTTSIDPENIVVTLSGPEKTMIVRRKNRVLGAWMNNETVEFRRVPSYYDLATNMDLTDPLFPENQIGVDNLGFYPEDDDQKTETLNIFRDALIRQMQERGFYPIKAETPAFITPRFFKTTFELPPGVPTGTYTVEALLIKGDAVLAKETKTLRVGQVGFNARVYSFAGDYSFFYGLVAVLIALFSGWSAFTFLRRD